MRFVSLFAGIGGFDLGLERAGFTCAGQVEIDDYATRVLEKHWPDVPRWRDVRTFTGAEFGPFDMLVGGYPCQPFSTAGHRKGVNDERHLWPEVHRIIRNVRPRIVLLENVAGHLSLGFDSVLGDLAACGYDAEWDCIPAAAIGAPHRRDRLFIVAYPNSSCAHGSVDAQDGEGLPGERQQPAGSSAEGSDWSPAVLPAGGRARVGVRRTRSTASSVRVLSRAPRRLAWPSESVVGGMAYGVSSRVERMRTLGNAVVPQVAEFIGSQIKEVWNAVQD